MLKKFRLVLPVFSLLAIFVAFSNFAWSQETVAPTSPAAPPSPNKEIVDRAANAETIEDAIAELSKLGSKNKAFFDAITPLRNVEGKMHTLLVEYQTATPEHKDAIQAEYEKLLTDAKKHRNNLIDTAIEAFNETPYDNFIVAEFCFRLVFQENARDNYEVSFKAADALIAHPEGLNEQAGGFYEQAANAAFGCMQFDKAEQWYAKAVALKTQLDRESMMKRSDIPEQKKFWAEEEPIREQEAKADNLPRVLLRTNKGDIVLELFEDTAPNTVANFISLVKKGYYTNVPFHRVLEGFMAQGGDPSGTGRGGPGYMIDCECYAKEGQPTPRKHFRGSISMANAGRDTNGSQFFLMFRSTTLDPRFNLNGKHTVFGRIIEGMDVLADIQRINPEDEVILVEPDHIVEAKVLRDRGHVYEPVKNRRR